MENKLEIIVTESGLETSKAQYIIDKFNDYFAIAADWEQRAKTIKVTDENQLVDMQMARTGRLFLREKRIAIEKSRKALKEQSLREGKAIDGIANVLKALIIPIEDYLDEQEHFVEIKEQKKREALLLEAQKREEEEKLENERLDKIAQERKEIALPYNQFWTTDNYDFRIMSKANFENIMSELREKKKCYDNEQIRISKENEMLKIKAKEEKEKALDDARKLAEKKELEEREKFNVMIKKEQEYKAKMERLIKLGIDCPFCKKHIDLI